MSEAKRVFFSDLKFPSMYYAALVRSPLQRGRLVEVRAPELPDGYFLFTAADIPGKNSVEINGGSVPVLAEGAVSYIGEPVGIIAGPDYEIALGLAERTEVVTEVIIEENADEEALPCAERVAQWGEASPFFEDEAAACDEPKSESQADGESNETQAGVDDGEDEGEGAPQEEALAESDTAESPAASDAESAVDKQENAEAAASPVAAGQEGEQEADDDEELVITETFAEIAPFESFAGEHLGAAVKYKKDRIEVHTASRWPFHVKKTVAAVLSLSSEKIAVTPTSIAASVEGKMLTSSLAAARAALAAFLCKKPVKLVLSRDEEFQYSAKSPPVKIRIKSAAAPSGKIAALHADIEINPGSKTPFINEIAARMAAALRSLYNIENSKTCVRFAASNLPPMIPVGFGEREAFLAIEAHIDVVARQLGAMPQEVRQANIADAKHSSIIKAVCEASGFNRKYAAYESLNKRRAGVKDGPLRGIGLSLGYQGSGFLSAWQEGIQYSVEITMETTGQVSVKCGSRSSSIKEIIASLVSELLSLDKSLVCFVDAAPDDASFNGPDIFSSSIAIVVPLVLKCCSALQRQRFRNPLPITVKKTYKAAKSSAKGGGSLAQKSAFVSCTQGACAVELELNPLDFSISIRGIWIACATGRLLNRQNAERTLKRTAKMSLGALLAETAKIEGGRFRSTNRFGGSNLAFLPVPEPKVFLIDSKEMPCGLGVIAHNLLPGAYCAAIAQITQRPDTKAPVTTKYLHSRFAGNA